MAKVEQIDIEAKRMSLFCQKRNWHFVGIQKNKKNKNQFLAECLDEHGMTVYILVGTQGNLWQWIGPKKWEKIKF